MHIGKNNDTTYYMEENSNIPLNVTKDEKDVGVIIDDTLSYDMHINYIINKANSTFGVIRRSFETLDTKSFLSLYTSMVRSYLDYAVSVWAPYKVKHIEALENVQRRATRQLPDLKNLEYEDRLKKLKLPTLTYRRNRGDMINTFKILNGLYDQDACNDLLPLRKDHAIRSNTRTNSLALLKLRANKDIRKYNFTNRVVNLWNSLPENVVQAPSLNSFKNRLDKLWAKEPVLYQFRATIDTGRRRDVDIVEEDEPAIEA
jgi:hypothetical protein